MSPVTLARTMSLLAALVLLLGAPATSVAVSFDLTSSGDFGISGTAGTGVPPDSPIQATKEGVTLSLAALSGLLNEGNLDLSMYVPLPMGTNPDGLPAQVEFDSDGLGVRGWDPGALGSKDISGLGGFGDEAAILDFGELMLTSSTVLHLTHYSISDDTILIYLDNTLMPQLDDALIESALIPTGSDSFALDFSNPDILDALVDVPQFQTMYVRAQEGHFLISQIDAALPEPTPLILLGLSVGGLLALRRSRRTPDRGPAA